MTRAAILIVGLAVLLVSSNAWWAYRMLDASVSYTHQGDSLDDHKRALGQALDVIDAMSGTGVSRERIIAAAQGDLPRSGIFEKDGYIWVGEIGLRFAEDGALETVVPAWK